MIFKKIIISEKLIYFIESWNLIMGHFALMTLRFFINASITKKKLFFYYFISKIKLNKKKYVQALTKARPIILSK